MKRTKAAKPKPRSETVRTLQNRDYAEYTREKRRIEREFQRLVPSARNVQYFDPSREKKGAS